MASFDGTGPGPEAWTAAVPNPCTRRIGPYIRGLSLALVLIAGVNACDREPMAPGIGGETASDPAFVLVGPVSKVATGTEHACALGADGGIACWGGNYYGESVAPTGTFIDLDAKHYHNCAIRTDGTLTCWGRETVILDAPPGTYTRLSVSFSNGCAIATDGTLACWGSARYGVDHPPAGTFMAVSAGAEYACAIRTDGSLTCWGYAGPWGITSPPSGSFVQVSAGYDHACALRTDAAVVCWGYDNFGQATPPSGAFLSIDGGSGVWHTCGIRPDRSIECWGLDSGDLLSPPTGEFTDMDSDVHRTCAVRIDGTVECWSAGTLEIPGGLVDGPFVKVVANGFTCGLRPEGTLVCWPDSSPYLPAPSGPFTAFDTDYAYGCAIEPGGSITCWGQDPGGYGVLAPPAGTFVDLSAANTHGCGLRDDGSVVCWGDDLHGQLQAPAGMFEQVAAGGAHTCALALDQTIHCWGYNTYGQTDVPGGLFTQVTTGTSHTCGLRLDGSVECWGSNFYGEIDPPSDVFSRITAGALFACGLKADGSVVCWGWDRYGQSSPPAVPFTAIHAGRWAACGIAADASFECWGRPTSTTLVWPNEPPSITAIKLPADPIALGTTADLAADFMDPDPSDSHTAIIDWGDGTSSAGIVVETGGMGQVSGSHSYAATGVYTVTVTVSDGQADDTRSSASDIPAYIVVYDATAGFVTGAGWFDSPPGACTWIGCAQDGSSTGKATFGFVSRYQSGATAPTGNTQFRFHAGDLHFSSVEYDWLVIAGARAQYKGRGAINGAGDFGFLITAIDAAVNGGGSEDRFRIKIWDTASGDVVYDNQRGTDELSDAATAIRGGNVVIHR